MNNYDGKLAELYDYVFSAWPEEIAFFEYFLKQKKGPALEIGCGTGQFLIPFVKDGFDVMGLDISADMINKCREKANRSGVAIDLVSQAMQDMKIDKVFSTIYIPSCSFMHVTDLSEAQRSLALFYNHLEHGGQLLITLFKPSGIQEEFEDVVITSFEYGDEQILFFREFAQSSNERLQIGRFRFEAYKQEHLQWTESQRIEWRWYELLEFETMLSQAGFKSIEKFCDYNYNTSMPPHELTETVIFRALKL